MSTILDYVVGCVLFSLRFVYAPPCRKRWCRIRELAWSAKRAVARKKWGEVPTPQHRFEDIGGGYYQVQVCKSCADKLAEQLAGVAKSTYEGRGGDSWDYAKQVFVLFPLE